MRVVRRVEELVKKRGGELETKFNRYCVGFKYGFPIVFGVEWMVSKSFALFFKLPEAQAASLKIDGLQPHRYEETWKQVVYKVDSKDFPVEKLAAVFDAAYRHVTSKLP